MDFSTVTAIPRDDGGTLYSGGNTFTVAPGTPFFVPLFNVNDLPPIIGDFPTDPAQAPAYLFGPAQIGARDFEIIVDGNSTAIGPAYVAGPVPIPTSGGASIITLGAFLSPLSVGTHTVTIRGVPAGAEYVNLYGVEAEDFT